MKYYVPMFEKIVRFEDAKLLSAIIDVLVRIGVAEVCSQNLEVFDLVQVDTGVVLLGGAEIKNDYVIADFVDDEFEVFMKQFCDFAIKKLGSED